VNQIAPLVASERPSDVALAYLRAYEGQRRRMARIANDAKKPMEKLAAAKAIVATIEKEISLRQTLGLLPRDLADLPHLESFEFVLDEFVKMLRRLGAGQEVFEELHAIMSGRIAAIHEAPYVGNHVTATPETFSGAATGGLSGASQ
jgi:hypothetical protein